MKKIVFVGGPTSGKTSVINGLKKALNDKCDINVDFVDELGTLFFMNVPGELLERDDVCLRQIRLYRMQLMIENKISEIRGDTPSIMICDRGIADLRAYLTPSQIELSFTPDELALLDKNYDSVYFFASGGADTAQNLLSENPARIERDGAEIYALSKKTFDAWSSCPNFHYIERYDTVDERTRTVASLINGELGVEVFKLGG